jgi:opacity protein-like surface antigen
MKRITVLALAAVLTLAAAAASTSAQRQKTVQAQAPPAQPNTPKPPPAPASVKAKYEGGMVGYKKTEGTLNFDDANARLVFRDKQGRELFGLAYNSLLMAWPDTRSSTSTTGRVLASTVPYGLGLPGLLMKNKSRYMNLRYQDPDTGTEGATSFKISDKALLASFLDTLGDKAGLAQRGDAYIRRKDASTTAPTQPGSPD